MRLCRFIDQHGQAQLGTDRQDGTARVVHGDLFEDLRETDERVQIKALLAPIEPRNIFCIGLNYRAHAEETGAPIPEQPVIFMKPTTAVTATGKPIRLPACSRHGPEVDYEAELAVVIGKAARDVPADEALDHVFGYTSANDVSARRWQKHGGGGQWIRGKSFDTFCPLGPELVTADELPDPQTLPVESRLNGEVMQRGHTSDMIFSVARLIAHLSQDTTLLPGTVILTGTPPGVGFARTPPVFLAAGDEISVRIGNLAELSNPVEQA